MLPKASDSFLRASSPCLGDVHSILCRQRNKNKHTESSAEGCICPPLVIKVHGICGETADGNAGDSEHRRGPGHFEAEGE